MGAILSFPNTATAEAAWARYVRLVREAERAPLLWEDQDHIRARAVAHEAFSEAFEKLEGVK